MRALGKGEGLRRSNDDRRLAVLRDHDRPLHYPHMSDYRADLLAHLRDWQPFIDRVCCQQRPPDILSLPPVIMPGVSHAPGDGQGQIRLLAQTSESSSSLGDEKRA